MVTQMTDDIKQSINAESDACPMSIVMQLQDSKEKKWQQCDWIGMSVVLSCGISSCSFCGISVPVLACCKQRTTSSFGSWVMAHSKCCRFSLPGGLSLYLYMFSFRGSFRRRSILVLSFSSVCHIVTVHNEILIWRNSFMTLLTGKSL